MPRPTARFAQAIEEMRPLFPGMDCETIVNLLKAERSAEASHPPHCTEDPDAIMVRQMKEEEERRIREQDEQDMLVAMLVAQQLDEEERAEQDEQDMLVAQRLDEEERAEQDEQDMLVAQQLDEEERARRPMSSAAAAGNGEWKPPMYWSSALTATAYSQFDVTAEMRTRMQAVVDQSCTVFGVGRDLRTPWGPYTGLRIKKVWRIENPALWRLYSAQRMFVLQNCRHGALQPLRVACYEASWMKEHALLSDCNELYLFHGTKPEVVPLITQQGFETRLPPDAGRMLGDGVYFAENASKSDQYGVPNGKTFYLFVARVCLGAAYTTNSPQRGLKRPPTTAAGPLFDSVLYDCGFKHREFVVYDRTACYPEFLLEYERE